MLIVCGASLWAFQTIYIKRWLEHWHPIPLVLYPMILGVIILLCVHMIFESDAVLVFDKRVLIALVYQAIVVVGFGYVAWTNLLLTYRASNLSTFVFIMPVAGVFLGTVFMGDPITVRLILGLIFIASGILVVNIRPRGAFLIPE
jgi:drug/metabolite transporter (DMT)-like permease